MIVPCNYIRIYDLLNLAIYAWLSRILKMLLPFEILIRIIKSCVLDLHSVSLPDFFFAFRRQYEKKLISNEVVFIRKGCLKSGCLDQRTSSFHISAVLSNNNAEGSICCPSSSFSLIIIGSQPPKFIRRDNFPPPENRRRKPSDPFIWVINKNKIKIGTKGLSDFKGE